MGRVTSAISRLLSLVYPSKCVCCGELLDKDDEVFCRTCYDRYENAKQEICSRCLQPRCRCTCPSFSLGKAGLRRLVKLYKYQPSEGDLPENRILFALKQRHLQSVFDFFARDLAEAIEDALTPKEKATAILVPCPRSDRAKAKNGYDHMERLSVAISREIGFPVSLSLRRARGGRMQKKLSAEERRTNVENRFFVTQPEDLVGKTVLLLDDLTTSGATLLECRRVVKAAGAARVIPCVIAVSGRDFVIRPRKTRKKGKSYKKKRPTAGTQSAPRPIR